MGVSRRRGMVDCGLHGEAVASHALVRRLVISYSGIGHCSWQGIRPEWLNYGYRVLSGRWDSQRPDQLLPARARRLCRAAAVVCICRFGLAKMPLQLSDAVPDQLLHRKGYASIVAVVGFVRKLNLLGFNELVIDANGIDGSVSDQGQATGWAKEF